MSCAKSSWLALFALCVLSLCYAHFFLQEYLFMRPCEKCVLVRFAFCVIALGAFVAFIAPQNKLLKALAFALCAWGVAFGAKHSLALHHIQQAFKENNPFGVSGCSHAPHFPFGLPLDTILPSFFRPNGVCGLDTPIIPAENAINLSAVQRFFVGSVENNFTEGFYSKGWFLLPQFEFISMPQACLLLFGALALALGVGFVVWGKKNLSYALCAFVVAFGLICFA